MIILYSIENIGLYIISYVTCAMMQMTVQIMAQGISGAKEQTA